MSVHTTAGAILAGGRARRFGGRDKSRLIVQGCSIIVRQVELLQRVTDAVVVVGHDPTRFADLPVTVVPDVIPGAGALGGILTALESSSADRVLVIACDLPFLTEGLLRALLTLAESGDGAWVETERGLNRWWRATGNPAAVPFAPPSCPDASRRRTCATI